MPIWKQKQQRQQPDTMRYLHQIKAAEKRMAEIAVLRTHIVNYAKTRETYVAYRKAGYSQEILRRSMRRRSCCTKRPRKPSMS